MWSKFFEREVYSQKIQRGEEENVLSNEKRRGLEKKGVGRKEKTGRHSELDLPT